MKKIIKVIVLMLIFIAIWQVLIFVLKIPQYLIPSPVNVINAIVENYQLIGNNLVITFREAFFGFLIANIISVCIGIHLGLNPKFEAMVMSIAIVLKTIPIVAIVPLLVIWFGSGEQTKIATSALICFFPSLVNMIRGVKSINNDLLDLFELYNASISAKVKYLIVPSTLPFLFSSLKISSSLAIVGALVGEFVGSNKGMGFLILTNYYSINTPMVFASIIVISLLGILSYYLIHFLENKFVTWTEIMD